MMHQNPRGLVPAVLLGVLVLATPAVPEQRPLPCGGGRFVVPRNLLVGGGPAARFEVISVAPGGIATSTGCAAVEAGLRPAGGGTKVRASWRPCSGLLDRIGRPARAKLVKGFIAAPTCNTLTGTLVVGKGRPRRRSFTATLTRCGDGNFDPGNNEECDGDTGCAPGVRCTDRCTCDATATTTTTTTSPATSTTMPGNFTCTEILGFSQSLMWHETPEFQQRIDNARWQMRFRASGDVDLWADPNADAWNPPVRTACLGSGSPVLCTPCAQGSDAPDRVLFTISLMAYETDVQVWAQKIRAAIATIRMKHPQVQQIVLQPVVGGPMHGFCPFPNQPQGVRASFNHPHIDQAISLVVQDSADLVAGFSPEVQSCNDYADEVGHLIESGRGPVGQAVGNYYGP